MHKLWLARSEVIVNHQIKRIQYISAWLILITMSTMITIRSERPKVNESQSSQRDNQFQFT